MTALIASHDFKLPGSMSKKSCEFLALHKSSGSATSVMSPAWTRYSGVHVDTGWPKQFTETLAVSVLAQTGSTYTTEGVEVALVVVVVVVEVVVVIMIHKC